MRSTLLLTVCVIATSVCAQPLTNDGPDAPDFGIFYEPLTGFSFSLSNSIASNNPFENYVEGIIPEESTPDRYWRFQGYIVYQFATPADANDSLPFIINDPLRAKPTVVADEADLVDQAVDNLDPTGAADCVTITWIFNNTGTAGIMSSALDPFTNQPYDPDQEYCFLAVAFATNPYHQSVACDTLQQMIKSRKTGAGALQGQCVVGSQLGVEEEGLTRISLNPNVSGEVVRIDSAEGMALGVHVFSSIGALVHSANGTGSIVLDVRRWPAGIYRAVIADRRGALVAKPFVVAR